MGSNSIHNGDEALYAIISREMLISGDWLTPRTGGEPCFNKPPLKFWLTAVCFRFFGTSEWVTRFWSAATAVACVFFSVLLAKELFGEKEALWSGFSLTTCFHFIYEHCARTGEMDAILLFFLVSSMYLLIRSEKNPRLLLVSSAVMGLASLTKNFAGFLPFGIGLLYLLVTGKWRNYRVSGVIQAVLLFLIISTGWFIAMIQIHKHAFLNEFFIQQVYNRATSTEYGIGVNEAKSLTGGILFIGKTILKGFYPWSLLLPLCLVWAFFRIPRWRKDGRILPLIWLASFGIVLLLCKNKLHWYVLPLYPAASILIGKFIAESFSVYRIDWKNTLSCVFLFCGFFLLLPNYSYNLFSLRAVDSRVSTLVLNPHPVAAPLFIAGSIILWIFIARRFPRLINYFIPAVLLVYAATFVMLPLRYASHQSEIQKLTTIISQQTRTSERTLYFWGIPETIFEHTDVLWKPPKIAKWYFSIIPNTHISFLTADEDEICRRLETGGSSLFLMPYRYYQQIQSTCYHQVLASQSVRGNTYVLVSPVKK
ncbi:MAG: glycosyltransferase family 39 protein [Planctomycetes bacterium]|nr:glycosyltransferase family 39 protein [Planctomycetota bacterium]